MNMMSIVLQIIAHEKSRFAWMSKWRIESNTQCKNVIISLRSQNNKHRLLLEFAQNWPCADLQTTHHSTDSAIVL